MNERKRKNKDNNNSVKCKHIRAISRNLNDFVLS